MSTIIILAALALAGVVWWLTSLHVPLPAGPNLATWERAAIAGICAAPALLAGIALRLLGW